ncbi:esterase [Actinoplanes philippinensis]|uniref:Platelet-activating factor acetylhydrolase, isoform II n=1 Tax=Actinoplanes philippinensis TaxID=35752 RepID=A0A1I2HZG9_9ACTN|nr:hydrolase [Actinoplanes philippinensis]GIE78868.1 esterase [Actinoplanes philippinensis]SFF34760.1 Platelet-activating factor acetylhydrolase, isoform II [Actinoplanes philippinensis]
MLEPITNKPAAVRPLRRRTLLTAVLASGAGLAVAAPAAARTSDPGPATGRRAAAGYVLPAPTGPADLGTVAVHLRDTTRTDPWAPGHPPREIMIQIWYPARDLCGHLPEPWLSPGAVPHFAETFGLPADRIRSTRTHGRTGAPVLPRRGGHPVLLYSPGLGGDRGTGTVLVEDLAAHGYIVVTIDHTHDASEVEFPGGRVEVAALPPDLTDEVVVQAAAVRDADTRFVLDQLAALDAGRNPDAARRRLPDGLRGAFDLSRIGMFGHSLGGSTAAAVMHDDPRLKAGVNLDGTFVGPAATGGSARPFLLISSDHGPDAEDPTWTRFWSAQQGWKRQLRLRDTVHGSFNDGVSLYPQAALEIGLTPQQLAGMVGTLAPPRSVEIQRTYLRAFFDQHLRCRDGRLLAAPDPRYPEIHFVR